MALNGHAPSHDRPAVFMLYLNAPAQDAYPSLCSFAALRVAGAGREGWMLMKTAYDDGGFSGGSMDRPALQRVLSDLQAGSVYVLSYQDDMANVRVGKETVIADPNDVVLKLKGCSLTLRSYLARRFCPGWKP